MKATAGDWCLHVFTSELLREKLRELTEKAHRGALSSELQEPQKFAAIVAELTHRDDLRPA